MTKEETKKCIEIMQAYVDGKEMQTYYAAAWHDVTPTWAWNNNPGYYRIKPEQHIRPYKDMEEFLKARAEHGGWLRHIDFDYATTPVYVDNSGAGISGGTGTDDDDYWYERIPFDRLLEEFTWIDGAACGVMEE